VAGPPDLPVRADPITKRRLLEREAQFAWIYRKDFPEWGRGRDDAMNLTKYFMLKSPMDDSVGPTDMPAVWNLKKYSRPGHDAQLRRRQPRRPLGGHRLRARLMNAKPKSNDEFLRQVRWLEDYLATWRLRNIHSRSMPRWPRKAAVVRRRVRVVPRQRQTGTRMALAASTPTAPASTPGAAPMRSPPIAW
jgi:hypothetical protein